MDDISQAEAGGADAGVARLSERTTHTKVESARAGLSMARQKCVQLPIQPLAEVGRTTAADVAALKLKFHCVCGEAWVCKAGLLRHMRACDKAHETFERPPDGETGHVVEMLLECRGPKDHPQHKRYWRVKWAGVDAMTGADLWPDEGTGDGTGFNWQPEDNLDGDDMVVLVQSYWRTHRDLDQYGENDRPDEFRCPWCNLLSANAAERDLHVNGRRGRKPVRACKPKPRSYGGTKVDIAVKRAKREAEFARLGAVEMDGDKLKVTSYAPLLGRIFESDGDCDRDVTAKCAAATTRWSQLRAFWEDSQLRESVKLAIFCRDVLSRVAWGSCSWNLTEAVQRKLTGWASRRLVPITGKSYAEESRPETQSLGVVGIFRYRRMQVLGHFLRADPGCLERKEILQQWELIRRGFVLDRGTLISEAPAASSTSMLVWLAGGSGSIEDREQNQQRWQKWAKEKLSPADRERMKKKKSKQDQQAARFGRNTAAQTAAALATVDHQYRIYTDGGADGNGARGHRGASGWGVHVQVVSAADTTPAMCDVCISPMAWCSCGLDAEEAGEAVTVGNADVTAVADLWGPVVTDPEAAYYWGAPTGTNNTGELSGVIQGLLWLLHVKAEETTAVIFLCDSCYSMDVIEERVNAQSNVEMVELAKSLLARVRETRKVHFVHVAGHSEDPGNNRADELVQWGKEAGPHSRLTFHGVREGEGWETAVPDYVVRRDRRLSQKAAAKRRSSVNQAAEGGDVTPSGSGPPRTPARRRAPTAPAEGDPRTAVAPGRLEGRSTRRFDMAGLQAAVEAVEDTPDFSWKLGELLPKYTSTNLSPERDQGEGSLFYTSLSQMMAE
jgi:ribonuclease HI